MRSTLALAVCMLTYSVGASRSFEKAPSEIDFYQSKTIHLLVGTPAGSASDLFARLVANHMGRFIPGHPTIVVEGMPGAGSLILANYLYGKAPRDGTVIGLPLSGILLEPTLNLVSRGGGNASFDIAKMNWIGSPSGDAQVLWLKADSPIRSIADMKTTPEVVGASSKNADNYVVATLANQLLDAKFRIVGGYDGTSEIFLAAERGEIKGSFTGYRGIAASRPLWIKDGSIRLLMQFGADRLPELPDVPTALELGESDETKDMLRLFAIKYMAQFPFVLPPSVAPRRLEMVRSAFDATMRDAEFIAESNRSGMALDPVGGDRIAQMIRDTEKLPPTTLERLRALLKP